MDLPARLKRDAVIIKALIQARHALDCIEGAHAKFPDEPSDPGWTVDNRVEIDLINDALKLLGVDPKEPLAVPLRGKQKPP